MRNYKVVVRQPETRHSRRVLVARSIRCALNSFGICQALQYITALPHSVQLCELFDAETKDGEDMSQYSGLLSRAVTAIAAQFERKNAGNLFAGRGGKLTDAGKQGKTAGGFELITWLVIK